MKVSVIKLFILVIGIFVGSNCFAQHDQGFFLMNEVKRPDCRYDIYWNNNHSAEIGVSTIGSYYCDNDNLLIPLKCKSKRQCSFGPRKWKTEVRFTKKLNKMVWLGVENKAFSFFDESLCVVEGNEEFCAGDPSFINEHGFKKIVEILAISKTEKKALLKNGEVHSLSKLAGRQKYVVNNCLKWGSGELCEGQKAVYLGPRSYYSSEESIRILKIFSEENLLVENSGVKELVKAKNISAHKPFSAFVKVKEKHCGYILDRDTSERYMKRPTEKLMKQCRGAGFDYCTSNRGDRAFNCTYNIKVYGAYNN